jgi:hypothetical protein
MQEPARKLDRFARDDDLKFEFRLEDLKEQPRGGLIKLKGLALLSGKFSRGTTIAIELNETMAIALRLIPLTQVALPVFFGFLAGLAAPTERERLGLRFLATADLINHQRRPGRPLDPR